MRQVLRQETLDDSFRHLKVARRRKEFQQVSISDGLGGKQLILPAATLIKQRVTRKIACLAAKHIGKEMGIGFRDSRGLPGQPAIEASLADPNHAGQSAML
jgi:hypothetical protein